MEWDEMSADRPDRDGSRRAVTTVTDGVDSSCWPLGCLGV